MTLAHSMIHKTFEIAQDCWWLPYYRCDKNKTAKRISNLAEILETTLATEDQEFQDGCREFHREKYLLECICGESKLDLTYDDLNEILDGNKCDSRLKTKVCNLQKAIEGFLWHADLSRKVDFDVKLVKDIHAKIGADIIKQPGKFRTNPAKPAGEDLVYYLDPHLIKDRLQQLMEESQYSFSDPNLNLLDAVKYAACFLANFLYIHPFSNGNGRTARLLLSYLLSRFTVAPLSMNTIGKMREVYFKCIRDAHYNKDAMKPTSLARFILEAIERDSLDLCFVMDIPLCYADSSFE